MTSTRDYIKKLPKELRQEQGHADSVLDKRVPLDAVLEAAHKKKLMEDLGNRSSRSGGGGVVHSGKKYSGIGLQLGGRKRTEEFYTTFTESDNSKKDEVEKDPWLSRDKWTRNDSITPLAAITGSFCGGCGKRSGMAEIQICLMPLFPTKNGKRHAEMTGLKIGDLIGAIMCKRCFKEIKKLKDTYHPLSVRLNGETISLNHWKAYLWERRFEENVMEYLRQQRLSVDSPCFLNDRKEDRNPE